ncbi:2-dehydro-3-deoxygalactonokinase [Dyadobacter pollutisoli]|uniref:2-dehydro-3-deoxygalactonokinase n=1 Tax=Dyadobacter pollutisoli TaxID=2910158 RepID=A0A9E8NCK8_9BACT|nr:2-dehydro-3-deoxygalactonokinase [Dyadobacter pollutisoli]WAC14200.1 2-dehydro-3-deoxygalactonokinase [Dyadobacter pollutisoli]
MEKYLLCCNWVRTSFWLWLVNKKDQELIGYVFLDKRQNATFVSGLLIGSEICHPTRENDSQSVLCCQNSLYRLYKVAIETLNLPGRALIVPAATVDRAATAGKIKIFEHQNLTLNKTNL